MNPAPFVVHRDGTITDRATGTVVGHVQNVPGRGWRSRGPHRTHSGGTTRRVAAGWAWHEWDNRRRRALAQPGEVAE